MKRVLGGSLAVVMGIALGLTELMFAPGVMARMEANIGFQTEKYGAALIWTALVSVALVAGGLAAIFARPRNSN